MAEYGVTDKGFVGLTQEEIQINLEDGLLAKLGTDHVVDAESPLGNIIGVFSEALSQGWEGAEGSYNAFDVNSSFGNNLSALVQLNHIARIPESYTTVVLTCSGTKGTVIPAGSKVTDESGTVVTTDEKATLGDSPIAVKATCTTVGAVEIAAGSLITITTPVFGWDSVINSEDGDTGEDEETDVQLKARRATSVGIGASRTGGSIDSNIRAITNVKYVRVYENDNSTPEIVAGTPAKAIQVVVDGGDENEIAEVIYAKKAEGVEAYGSSTVVILDQSGFPKGIGITRPTEVPVYFDLEIVRQSVTSTGVEDAVKQAIVDFITDGDDYGNGGYGVNDNVPIKAMNAPAQTVEGVSYVESIKGGFTSSPAQTDGELAISFNQYCTISVDNINVTFV